MSLNRSAGEQPIQAEAPLAQLDYTSPVSPRIISEAKEAAKARARAFQWDPSGCSSAIGQAKVCDAQSSHGRPLNVVLADPSNSLFEAMRDPRLTISAVQAISNAPDVLVLNANSMKRLMRSAASVPDELWRHVVQTGVKVVLDASGEGLPHKPARTDTLHDFLRSRGVDPACAAYVTQTRSYASEYEPYCDALGMADRRMAVWIYDRFIQTTFAPFHDIGEREFEQRLARYLGAGRTRSRRFICFNNILRPFRVLFLLRLLQENLLDRGFVSIGSTGNGGEQIQSKQELIANLRSWNQYGALNDDLRALLDELSPYVDELLERRVGFLGVDASKSELQQHAQKLRASSVEECAESWFTVVPESDFFGRLNRITEKPFKALVNFHPLIVLGSVGSLRLIRAYGFDTDSGFFDEAYDDEPDQRARLEMVFEQVARLCRMEEHEIARLDEDAAATAVFNAWWGLVELPKLFRSRIDAALVDGLMALEAGRPGRPT
jgi:hypothetical protein